jgi:hypothetical protein
MQPHRGIFHGFSLHLSWVLDELLMISCVVSEHIFADRCTASNRNKLSKTAKNLQKSLQRNCIAPIYRFAKRQQLQQTHAPKRRFTK